MPRIDVHSKEELNEVAMRAKDGDEECLMALAKMMRPYLVAYLRRFKNYERDQRDEMTQHAWLGVWTALEKFDPDKGVKFSTFAWEWMRHEVMEYISKNSGALPVTRKAWHFALLLDKAYEAKHGPGQDINTATNDEINSLEISVNREGELVTMTAPNAAETIRARKSSYAFDPDAGHDAMAQSAEDEFFSEQTEENEMLETAYKVAQALGELKPSERQQAALQACEELGWPPGAADIIIEMRRSL